MKEGAKKEGGKVTKHRDLVFSSVRHAREDGVDGADPKVQRRGVRLRVKAPI